MGPDFIGIGGRRCGTTSLYHAMKQHPQIDWPGPKEHHYFDVYRNKIPLETYLGRFKSAEGHVSGEITPRYLYTPAAWETLAKHCPDVKIICLVRDPTEAFISHYWRAVYRKQFPRSQPIGAYYDAWVEKDLFWRFHYARWLREWEKHFQREQIWVCQSEMLWLYPDHNLGLLWDFLDIEQHQVSLDRKLAAPRSAHAPEPLLKTLRKRFRPWVEELNEWVLGDTAWKSSA